MGFGLVIGFIAHYNSQLQFTVHYNTDYFSVFTSIAWQQLPTTDIPLLSGSCPSRLATISSNCQLPTDSLNWLTTQLGVSWLQSSIKGYSSRPLAQKLHFLTMSSLLYCSAHGLLARAQDLLSQTADGLSPNTQAPIRSSYIASGWTPQKTPLLAVTL
jgi:hypothetical protein